MLGKLKIPLVLLPFATLASSAPLQRPGVAPLAAAQEEQAEPAAPAPLPAPDTLAAALEMTDGIADKLEGRAPQELQELLAAWMPILRSQRQAVGEARAAAPESAQHQGLRQLETDLDRLAGAAEKIVSAIAAAGGDVRGARAALDALRQRDVAELSASSAPETMEAALRLDVEVLRAELRPLRRDQITEQLEAWLDLLQQSCLAVRNVEIATLETEEADALQANSERAVELRGERARLIDRVRVVIDALEAKGGEVDEARAYVDSVVVAPPVTGLRAAWATSVAWLRAKDGGIATGIALAKAIGILVAFWILARGLSRLTRRATRSMHHTSALLREFLEKSVGRVCMLLGILIALTVFGLDMTPMVAAIGAAGLVIGLALQGTLGNLASGLMIMIYRPFDIGNVIITAGVTGKVEGMTLMTTTVKTLDNQTIHVPNSSIWGDVITNVTANDTRRVDLVFGIAYEEDIDEAKQILQEIVRGHPKVLEEPEPNIRVHELADSSVNLIVRPWTNTADYWEVYWDLTEAVKRTFDKKGISIPFPQRDVHLIPVPEAAAPETKDATLKPQQPPASVDKAPAP